MLQPFQELSRRKRKDVKVEDITVQVCLFAFDLLYLNGEVGDTAGVTPLGRLMYVLFFVTAVAPPDVRRPTKTPPGALPSGTVRI